LEKRFEAGEFEARPDEFCRLHNALTLPANFAHAPFAGRVPDVCVHENEWPKHLWPYFGALLGSFGDYDWLPELARLQVDRLAWISTQA
ncbi:MAG: hypothetical protein ACRDIC_21810, partial [bacterium]